MEDRTRARGDDRREEVERAVGEAQENGREGVRTAASEATGNAPDTIDRIEAAGKFWEMAAEMSADPLTRGIARTNIELLHLVRRRVHAYAELPDQLARCHGLEDLLKAQARFFIDMVSDYQASVERLVENWWAAAAPPISATRG